MFEHFERDARLVMRACCVRGILLDRIFSRKTITYQELAQILKTLPGGGELAQSLSLITADDAAQKRPLSVAVVVNSRTGVPGKGFFDQCRELGLLKKTDKVLKDPYPHDFKQFPAYRQLSLDKDFAEVLGEINTMGLADEDEKEFWLQQATDLGVSVDQYWDHEIQADLGHPSGISLEIPPHMWNEGVDPVGGHLATPKFKINGQLTDPPSTKATAQPDRIRAVLLRSKTCRIPAYLLQVGDVVVVNRNSHVQHLTVQSIWIDPVMLSATTPIEQRDTYDRFVRWTDTSEERYREPLHGSLLIQTPANILERLDPRNQPQSVP